MTDSNTPADSFPPIDRAAYAVIGVLNSQYVHSSLAPWCLLAGVQTYGYAGVTAAVVEGTVNEPLPAVAQRIASHTPCVVGLCCYIWNITATYELVTLLKGQLPGVVIVLGGPEVSYNAAEVLQRHPLVDYVIAGEGEEPFARLLNALAADDEPRNIPGLCRREGERVLVSPPHTPQGEPPSPYSAAYFAALKGRMAYLETSRGCPFTCAFCLSGRCGTARFFNIERAKREMLLLANSGTQTVKLVDRTFNIRKERADELFRFIIKNYGQAIPRGVCFHFEIAGDLLDGETLALLQTAPAGAIQLEIGLQSFHAETLEAIRRRTDIDRLQANIRRLMEGGNMHIHIDLIAGLPREDWDTFARSVNTAYALQPHMLQLGFLKLLHGSPMREQPDQYPCRFADTPPYEVIDTPWLSAEELRRLHHTEDALDRLYNSGRFRRTLAFVMEQTGMTPFELFTACGEFMARHATARLSLDAYTALVLAFFGSLDNVDAARLRDVMVRDRMATNASGHLPPVLVREADRVRLALRQLRRNAVTCSLRGVKRGAAWLPTENALVFADYHEPHPVTGEYPLRTITQEELAQIAQLSRQV